jgi:hypothetical protein
MHMHRKRVYRLGLCLAMGLGLGSAALSVGPKGPAAAKEQSFDGKVVALADVLKKAGAKLDADAAPHWLALVSSAGKVYPLVKDDGSRMFFKDARLLNRPMRLIGRLVAGDFLQVVQVHSVIKGQLHEVDYWCDICSIRAFEPGKCACCGGPMALRETPVK